MIWWKSRFTGHHISLDWFLWAHLKWCLRCAGLFHYYKLCFKSGRVLMSHIPEQVSCSMLGQFFIGHACIALSSTCCLFKMFQITESHGNRAILYSIRASEKSMAVSTDVSLSSESSWHLLLVCRQKSSASCACHPHSVQGNENYFRLLQRREGCPPAPHRSDPDTEKW